MATLGMMAVGQRRPLKPAPYVVLSPLIEKGGTMGLCAEADRCWAWRTGQFWLLAVAEESMLCAWPCPHRVMLKQCIAHLETVAPRNLPQIMRFQHQIFPPLSNWQNASMLLLLSLVLKHRFVMHWQTNSQPSAFPALGLYKHLLNSRGRNSMQKTS